MWYDWVISGAQSYAINDNEVTVIWEAVVWDIGSVLRKPFLLQVDDHDPGCSGFETGRLHFAGI